jgi:pimeloyl-ACP methyl ester carboxylesterase
MSGAGPPQGAKAPSGGSAAAPAASVGAPITWVLLRGLTREARHWGRVPKDLQAQLGAGHRVLALDLPGNGALHEDASPTSVSALVDACRAALAARGMAPPYVLVAMSLGAMAAMHWSDLAPEEIAGCVLINTSTRRSPFWQRLRPRNWMKLVRLLRPGLPLLERESLVLAMTSSDPQRHVLLPQRWAAIAQQCPVTRVNALRQLLAAMRHRPPRRRPVVPVLLLASAGDTLVSPRCSLRIAADWDLPLAMHPDAGHDLPLDDPQWLLRRISGWWKG